MNKRASILIGVLVSIVIAFMIGLIAFLPARDTTAKTYALTLALFPICLFIAAWLFFVGIPGFVAFILEKFFWVDK